MSFDGKTALVTGAASGIGLEITRRLVEAGALVIAADLDREQVVGAVTSFGAGVESYALDVRDEMAVGRLVDTVVARHGSLNLAVNNAGIGSAAGPIHETPVDHWNAVTTTNLGGVFHCLRHELRVMRSGGGAIVNMASVLGTRTFANAAAYVASKHAVLGLTKVAALEYAPAVRVNAVCPGFIDTPPLRRIMSPEQQAELVALHPAGRLGEVSDVADVTLFLLSDAARFVTGSNYAVDGGYSVRP